MSSAKIIISRSPEETFEAGKNFASGLDVNSIVGFFGDLGSGKTQFIKGMCDFFKVEETVNSPTFVIVNEYSGIDSKNSSALKIFHFDFYRLKDMQDIINIGVESYVSAKALCLIEWAELADKYLRGNLKKIFFEHGSNESERIIKFF